MSNQPLKDLDNALQRETANPKSVPMVESNEMPNVTLSMGRAQGVEGRTPASSGKPLRTELTASQTDSEASRNRAFKQQQASRLIV